ncbi:siroheme synthase [Thalassotalea sediminis]|uniref:siroheme synthase n=1 Tax=Thalassotalea sediminis TaxID=1759089 RepID=UPI00257389E4|nr:NAD(P)-dependent oxidoreductase [Thalassotalea sediminis]
MKYFPIFLTAKHLNALVIGGGDVAARKIELLRKANCNITVMSEHCNESVTRLIRTEGLSHIQHNYQQGLIEQYNLVIAATDCEEVNQQVALDAKQQNILVNVVDQPELCTWITPSIIDRDPMIIALSSSGSAPILLRMLREQIEKSLPDGYGKLAKFSLKFRDHVKARIKGIRNRRAFWEVILRGPIGQAVLDNNTEHAETQLIQQLKTEVLPPKGEIVFIHTLVGNPDTLTLAAHREMQFADALFYDKQVNPAFIEYVRRDADKYPQEINADILINAQHALDLAEKGQKVIYLLAGHQAIPHNSALTLSQIKVKELVCGI